MTGKPKKPTPKELVINWLGMEHPNRRWMEITVATEDAKSWIETEAIQFGRLRPPDEYDRHYTYRIGEEYDPSEVYTYLNSYND